MLPWVHSLKKMSSSLQPGLVVGGGNKYFLDGVEAPLLTLTPGQTYKFDLSSDTLAAHPFYLSDTANGTHSFGSIFTGGVTNSQTDGTAAGQPGAHLTIVVDSNTPDLFYFCEVHYQNGGMGNGLIVQQSSLPFIQPQLNYNQSPTEDIDITISEVQAGEYAITVTNWSGAESDLEGAVVLYAKDASGAVMPVTLSESIDFTLDQSTSTTYSATVDVSSSLTDAAIKIGAFIDENGNAQLDAGTLVNAKLTLGAPDFNSDLVISFDHQGTSDDTTDDFVYTYRAPTIDATLVGNMVTVTVSNVSLLHPMWRRRKLVVLMTEIVSHYLLLRLPKQRRVQVFGRQPLMLML